MPGFVEYLPHFHASCNACAAICQIIGWRAIRNKNESSHAKWMTTALLFSVFFLMSYLTYHYHMHGNERVYEGPFRPLYLFILISHIILAVAVVPMVLRTFYLAIKKRLKEHIRFGRATLAIWLYVSVTGVIVYFCVFHLN